MKKYRYYVLTWGSADRIEIPLWKYVYYTFFTDVATCREIKQIARVKESKQK